MPVPAPRVTPSPSATATDEPMPDGGAAHRHDRFFYGWWIVAVTFAGTFFATGIHDTVFSVLLKPISNDLHVSRTAISIPISISIWVGAILGPVAGRIMDKRGPRLLSTGGAFIIGLIFLLLSAIGQFWQFAAIYPVGRAASQTTMLGSISSTAVANWFIRKRGRALGIQAMAIGLGGATLSLLAQFIIQHWGWRAVFVVFGFCMWVVVVLPAALLLRHRPEDLGLLPDGDTRDTPPPPPRPASARGRVISDKDFTIREALHTPAFWALLIVSIIGSTGTGAIHLHLASYLTDVGISPVASAAIVSITALMGGLGSIFWGLLAERIAVHRGLIAIYLSAAISVVILASFTAIAAAFCFAVIFGLATRGGGVMLSVATADYYGRANLGTIQGIIVPIQIAGLGVGQVFAPVMQSATGSYRSAFLILAALYFVSAIIGATVRPPRDAMPPAPAPARA